MFLKFLNSDKRYEFTSGGYNIDAEKVKIDSADIPATKGGFIIINDDGIEFDYSAYSVPYEKTSEYITFTSDTKIYYTYLVYAKETTFVTSQVTNNEKEMENAVLQFSGQGKEFVNPEQKVLFDEDNFNIYKVVGGEVVKTTAEDKKPYIDEKTKEEFEAALTSKLTEISAASKAAIVAGIDLNNSHYSYETEDQNNISNAVTLANQTKLAVPYHADDESCRIYEPDEITSIYVLEETNLTHNVTYHNQLKLYIQTLTTKAEIEEVKYGETELTGEYLDTYNMIMAQAQEVIRHFIGQN